MIADLDDEVSFLSTEAYDFYQQLLHNTQAVIVGRRTYEIMQDGDFIADKTYVVLTSHPKETGRDNVFMTDDGPQTIIENLVHNNTTEILVWGGGITNTSFLKQNLIDQVILDIEPSLLGQGVCLCAPDDLNIDLTLEQVQEYGTGGVRLFYTIKK